MNKEEYTYKDIIIDPTSEEAKDAVGKECYFADSPTACLKYANGNMKLGTLESIKDDFTCPFIDGNAFPHGCFIVKKEPSYAERAKQWIEENNLKIGDYVRVTRKAEDFEDGWGTVWVRRMDDWIGKTLKVSAINLLSGGLISLECDDTSYNFPYFVLEKVDKPEPQYVPFESKEEFIEAFHYHDNVKHSETDDILMNYGMWIKSKYNETLLQVTIIKEDGIYTDSDSCIVTWKNLLNDFEFLSRTPCGKEADSYVG